MWKYLQCKYFVSIIGKADGHIECNSVEEKNGSKYLVFESKEGKQISIKKVHRTLGWH